MKKTVLMCLAFAGCLLWMPDSAIGHHGWAAFDSKKEVTFKATVTAFQFVNPHSVIEFEAKDEKGQVQKWEGELTSRVHLVVKGWTATTIKPGDELTIIGNPTKNGTPAMRVLKILRANGQELKVELGN